MYSIKEKMKLLRELLNPDFAEVDLGLLRDISPQNPLLASPIVSPSRAAEKILHALLDQTTADKIRLNRRGNEPEPAPEEATPPVVPAEPPVEKKSERTPEKSKKKKSTRK